MGTYKKKNIQNHNLNLGQDLRIGLNQKGVIKKENIKKSKKIKILIGNHKVQKIK